MGWTEKGKVGERDGEKERVKQREGRKPGRQIITQLSSTPLEMILLDQPTVFFTYPTSTYFSSSDPDFYRIVFNYALLPNPPYKRL